MGAHTAPRPSRIRTAADRLLTAAMSGGLLVALLVVSVTL